MQSDVKEIKHSTDCQVLSTETCHSSMLIALSNWTRRVSRCMDWLSGLFRLMAVLWLWCRWIWPRCIRRLSHSLRNSALRMYCRQNLNAKSKKEKVLHSVFNVYKIWHNTFIIVCQKSLNKCNKNIHPICINVVEPCVLSVSWGFVCKTLTSKNQLNLRLPCWAISW